jgi:hypothetical protein
MKYSAICAAVGLTIAASSISAHACNPLLGKDYGKFITPKVAASLLAKNNPQSPAKSSIVGLWHLVHTASDGSLFAEAYDTWHSDGTEEELINAPPAAGPICMGVWTQSGKSVQLLTHVTWLYDLNNSFVGTLNMTQVNKMKKGDGNKYTGTFDAKFYDPTGTLFQEITGTTTADRLD